MSRTTIRNNYRSMLVEVNEDVTDCFQHCTLEEILEWIINNKDKYPRAAELNIYDSEGDMYVELWYFRDPTDEERPFFEKKAAELREIEQKVRREQYEKLKAEFG
jgi:hypothetical protein